MSEWYDLSSLTDRVLAERQTGRAIDLLMNEVGDACLDRKVDAIAGWMAQFAIRESRISLLLSALTITIPWSAALRSDRQAIMDRVRNLDSDRADRLLHGFR